MQSTISLNVSTEPHCFPSIIGIMLIEVGSEVIPLKKYVEPAFFPGIFTLYPHAHSSWFSHDDWELIEEQEIAVPIQKLPPGFQKHPSWGTSTLTPQSV